MGELSNFDSLERYIGRCEGMEGKKIWAKDDGGDDFPDLLVSRLSIQENADKIRRIFMT
jgi:hypothetical protein